MVFVFALGLLCYTGPFGRGRGVMAAELIYLRIFQSPNWGLGAAIICDPDDRRRRASVPVDAPSPPGRPAMITRPGLLAICVAALVAVFLLMPLIAVIPVSFTPTRYLSMPDGEWSLRHYRADRKPGLGQGAWPVNRHRRWSVRYWQPALRWRSALASGSCSRAFPGC